MKSGIYRIININNNKSYVGSTIDFQARWKRHFSDLKNGTHSSIKLQRSYDKHGKDSFVCEIVEQAPYDESIISLEDYYITYFDSKQNGYNIANAAFGDTLSHHPNKEEIFKKISISLRENNEKLSEEERKNKFGSKSCKKGKSYEEFYGAKKAQEIGLKLSESNYNRQMSGTNNPFFGKTHSDEVRKRISATQKGRKKPHVKLSIEGTIYQSVAEAMKTTNLSRKVIERRCGSELFIDWFRL